MNRIVCGVHISDHVAECMFLSYFLEEVERMIVNDGRIYKIKMIICIVTYFEIRKSHTLDILDWLLMINGCFSPWSLCFISCPVIMDL